MLALLALNPLKSTDIIFFIVLAAIVALCIGVYFLIPVINKKQYKELRDNLQKREAAFKSNVRRTDGTPVPTDDTDGLSGEQTAAERETLPNGPTTDPTEDEKE